jgi:hypothetical protein
MTVRQPLGHQLAQLLAACTNVADGPHEINRIRLFWRKDIGFKQTTNLSERHYDKIVVSEQICITYGVAAIRQGPNAPPVVEQLKSSDSLGKLALYVDDGAQAPPAPFFLLYFLIVACQFPYSREPWLTVVATSLACP